MVDGRFVQETVRRCFAKLLWDLVALARMCGEIRSAANYSARRGSSTRKSALARTTTQFTLLRTSCGSHRFLQLSYIVIVFELAARADPVCTIGIAPSRVSEARCDEEIWTCRAGMGV